MKNIITSCLACVMASSVYAAGSVQLDRTRIHMFDGASKAQFATINNNDEPVLVNIAVTEFDGKPTSKFAVSPSLYQIQAQKTYKGTLVRLENLPKDRESVFWFNFTTITPEDKNKDEHSSLDFAIGQRVKVFYRPKGLDGNCASAANSLEWRLSEKGITVKNPSQIAVSLLRIKSSNQMEEIADVVLPKTERTYKVKFKPSKDQKFTYVDEYGAYIDHEFAFK